MAHGHRVYFLGTLTRNPEVRTAPNGMAVARYGVAVPTRRRQGDTWHPDVCRIEVVAFGPQAATVGAALRKGRGVLIEGRLQWRRWEQDGQYRRTREVIAERIQGLSHPRAGVLEVAGGRSALRRAGPRGVPPSADPTPVAGCGTCGETCGIWQTVRV